MFQHPELLTVFDALIYLDPDTSDGVSLEEAQKLISATHTEQRAFLTGKYRAKARVTHPDKDGTNDLMKLLNLSREWLTTAGNIREALVAFINTEKSRRDRENRKKEQEEAAQQQRPVLVAVVVRRFSHRSREENLPL